MQIVPLSAAEVLVRESELASLLRDAVERGASVGFLLPLSDEEVNAYWRGVAAQVASGAKVVFAALAAEGRLVGSAQLALESRPNGRHRAEVQKVLVRHAARGAGIGAALVRAVEEAARRSGRTLLFLDTSVGRSGAEEFYAKLGYTHAGGIPDFARDPDGTLAANAIFFKRL